MAIQMRRGLNADFDPSKMTPGEWAVAIDSDTTKQAIWMCFAPGVVKKIGSFEDYIRWINEYMAEHYSEYVPNIICPVEATATASQAYAVGDLVIYDAALWVVTQAISQGGTLTPNTNITGTTIEDLLDEAGNADVIYGMMGSVQTTSTASKAYSVGDLIVYNDTLYVVTEPISSGGTLTPNTNIETTTVDGQFRDVNFDLRHTYAMIASYEPTNIATTDHYIDDYIVCGGYLLKATSIIYTSNEIDGSNTTVVTVMGEMESKIEAIPIRSDSDGYHSVAIGDSENYTSATGSYAVAEGSYTSASGDSAHAEGSYTGAHGDYSHAEGYYTTASGDYQHVSGKYNIEDDNDTYAEIVGGGSDSTAANIRTLDWNGNAVYAGKITAGADATGNNDVPRLGQLNTLLSNKKNTQSAVSDPTASGNALSFIDAISQNAQGVITATKKSVTTDATPTQSSTNPVQSGGVYSELSALNSSLSDINTALSGAASETTGQSILTTEMAINTNLNTLLTRLADAPTEEAGSLIVQDLVQGNLLLAHLAINIEESGVF